MRYFIITLFLVLITIPCFAQVSDPIFWYEGDIRDYDNMIDDRENSCGEFMEHLAAIYVKYEFDYWYYPPPDAPKHKFDVWTLPYGQADLFLPRGVDEVIVDQGELLFRIIYVETMDTTYFQWYDGTNWWAFGGAVDTNIFCHLQLMLTHRPPDRVKLHPRKR